jgi:DNA-binding IclR family transcriptional regulator
MSDEVKSATRVFEILEFFREAQRPLRLSDIAERFNYPPSSVSGLLKTMTARGYLNFDLSKRSYFPTARLLQLVNWIPDFEEGVVMHAMKSLQQATGEMIVLGTMKDIYIEYLEVLRSSHSVQVWSPPGTRRLLIANSMGRLLLSQLAGSNPGGGCSQQVARIFHRTAELGMFNVKDFSLDELFRELQELRQKDYAFSRSRKQDDIFLQSSKDVQIGAGNPGGSMVSMLIPGPPNHRPLALGVAAPAERLAGQLDEVVRQLRAQVRHLAQVVESEPAYTDKGARN